MKDLNIDKQLFELEQKLDLYEVSVEPENTMELKQSIQHDINILKQYIKENPEEDEDGDIMDSLKDYEEILSY